MRTCSGQPGGYCLGLRAPNQFAFLNLTNEKYETPPPPHPASSASWKLARLGFLAGVLLGEWEMRSNYHRRGKFSAFPQASLPTPPPFLSPGSLRDLSFSTLAVGPEVQKRFPDSPRGGQLRLGLGSPAERSGGCRKGSCNPAEDAKEGRGRPEGRLPGRGRRIRGGGSVTGSWASPPLPAPAADRERLLREIC